LEAFNKKVKPLLVCFNQEIRDKITLDIIKIKDKATKTTTEKLKERVIFTKSECELVSGMPFKPTDQDSYEELMTMEDKEIKFWDKVNKIPNYMEPEEWERIRADYHIRMAIAKAEGIASEKDKLDNIFKLLEIKQLNDVVTKGELPLDVFIIADIATDGTGNLISRKWSEVLCHIEDIFKYEKQAIARDNYYRLTQIEGNEDRYEQWLDYLAEQEVMHGIIVMDEDGNHLNNPQKNTEVIIDLLKEKSEQIVLPKEQKKKRVYSEGDEEDDELEMEEDEDGNLTRTEEILLLDDEIDDTFGEKPDGYVFEEPKLEEKEDDGWLF
jgi:hypothetical protein